jgi:hypothetical protein
MCAGKSSRRFSEMLKYFKPTHFPVGNKKGSIIQKILGDLKVL